MMHFLLPKKINFLPQKAIFAQTAQIFAQTPNLCSQILPSGVLYSKTFATFRTRSHLHPPPQPRPATQSSPTRTALPSPARPSSPSHAQPRVPRPPLICCHTVLLAVSSGRREEPFPGPQIFAQTPPQIFADAPSIFAQAPQIFVQPRLIFVHALRLTSKCLLCVA